LNEVEPTLKCVIAWSDRRNLCSIVAEVLEARLGAAEVSRLGDESFAVHGTLSPDEIRDLIGEVLDDGESVIVVEFEKWSSRGDSVDAVWLLRRGH
jgi:hypothetical protein